ncbi:MAG: radical SAM protein [Candidatus Aureabacteria bacterium]|nr:radical SAM protein [Candidatus Auribacterota bacterium]
MILPVNAIIKTTRNCNLNCEYCHDRQSENRVMGFDQMSLAISRILAIKNINSFRFIWHGGEPLLAGIDFFRKAIAVQEYLKHPRQEIKNSLQTNGLLLTEKVLDFLEEFNFTVGVSLDGPETLHNVQRPSIKGKPTFARIMKKIRNLQQRNMSYGVITVLTSKSMKIPPRDFLLFYLKNKIFDICFLPVRSDNKLKGETLSGENYYRFMKELFDEWLLLDDPRIHIRELGDMLLLSMGLPGSMCSSSGSCVCGTYSIEPDGSVFHCDKFNRDNFYCFGNLNELDFNHLPRSAKAAKIRHLDITLPEVCESCEWRKHCAGGCSHDRLIEGRLALRGGQCHMRPMLKHIRKVIQHHPKVNEYIRQAEAQTSQNSRGHDT